MRRKKKYKKKKASMMKKEEESEGWMNAVCAYVNGRREQYGEYYEYQRMSNRSSIVQEYVTFLLN